MFISFIYKKKKTSAVLQLHFKIFALNVKCVVLFYFYDLFQPQLIQMLNYIISNWDV